MKVIVTGASGFIGRNFLLKAPKEWEIIGLYFSSKNFEEFLKEKKLDNIKAVKCDLRNIEEVKELAKKIEKKHDLCIYLAGNTDPQFSVKEPLFDAESNVVALINFLENFCFKDFIFFSSGAVYHGLKGDVSPKSKIDPKIPYAISKLASEQYVKFYKETRKSIGNYIIIRFFGAYGPYEPERKFYYKLVKNFGLEKRDYYEIYGDGNNFVDAMYIEDAIEGLLNVINSKEKDITVDFCSEKPIRIIELVKKVSNIFNIKDLKIAKRGISHENIFFFADNKEFEEKFGFKPRTSLREGATKYYNFLKQKYEK